MKTNSKTPRAPRPLVCTFFRDKLGEWRWKLESPNGNSIAVSGEGYKRLAGAEKGFERVQISAVASQFVYDAINDHEAKALGEKKPFATVRVKQPTPLADDYDNDWENQIDESR